MSLSLKITACLSDEDDSYSSLADWEKSHFLRRPTVPALRTLHIQLHGSGFQIFHRSQRVKLIRKYLIIAPRDCQKETSNELERLPWEVAVSIGLQSLF